MGRGWLLSGVALMSLTGCPGFSGSEGETDGDADSSSSISASNGETTPNPSTSASTASGSDTTSGPTSDTTQSTDPSDSNTRGTDDPSNPTTDPTSDTDSGDGSSTTQASDTTPTDTQVSDADSDTNPTESESDTTGECVQLDTEPNDGENDDDFVDLGLVACDTPATSQTGTLLDTDDNDIHIYDSVWDCNADQPRHVATVISGAVALCVLPLCVEGDTSVSCIEGEQFTTESGFVACCSGLIAVAEVDCSNNDDIQDTFVGVTIFDPADDLVCEDYEFSYRVVDVG